MTFSATWVRAVGDTQELLFAADSRLSGGETWDRCPKIFRLPRTDCLIAFSGGTSYAFPMLLQLINSIGSYRPSTRREVDITLVKSHALRIFNEMYEDVRDLLQQRRSGRPIRIRWLVVGAPAPLRSGISTGVNRLVGSIFAE